ncbi:hyaluronidase-3 isoform X2 [Accipiter gentilis]|uniref:hyaluronidase-3 isoform X2 n=1 Tax=Astur gentilis TaxID=8957 RepID=UPI00210F2969|nr:hyaluronidase-3 isoform X2 [Accipiter gentilis]XP_049682963.1 hyaluronidase-3 isoform X2 [Accipiter gentilis]
MVMLALVLWACLALGTVGGESPAPEPLAGGQPFTVVWNIPTGRCQRRFGVGLPLSDYGIVENQDGRFTGQNITIFYKNKFGLYPYLSRQGVPRNGGIPQRVPLGAHLARVAGDIRLLLQHAFRGLAVVDWEEWRPLWAQNWGAKRIYRVASEQWVRDQHGLLPARRRLRLARWEFEQAAQTLMEETLLLGRALRPRGLWGFYRFPDCLNGNWAKEANYTGQCRPAEVQRNNRLGWLWAASAALYPSIYLPPALPPALRRRYVHHRLREALRVAAFGADGLLPVVAYSRLSFRRSPRFLELADLVHTIGESAALGAAGLVLWGDLSYSRSAVTWEGPRVPRRQSPGTPTAARREPSACAPWSPSATCTGPRAGRRGPRATARLPPAACAGPRLAPCPPAPRRSCPPCDLCPPPAPAPASAPATPCSWPCWGSWHWRAWSWPRWPST